MQTNTMTLIDDLDEEILRVKHMVNSKNYNNYAAFNFIVRKYRNELKMYLAIIRNDAFENNIIDYKNC